MVEPFTVICETCRARLKVRDASVIGEIHACPKCQSMVLIAPPAGWSAQPLATVPSETLRSSPDFAQVTSPSEDAAEAFAAAAALAARPKAESASASNMAEPVAAASLQEASAPSWVTTIASAKLLVGSLLGSMLLAGGVALTAVSDGDAPEADKAPSAVVAEGKFNPHASKTDGVSPGATPTRVQTAEESTLPVEIIAAKPASEPAEEPTAPVPLESPRAEDTSAGPNEKIIVEADAGATSPAPATEALSGLQLQADPPLNDNSRAPVLKFDPLDFDPSQLSLAATSAANNEAATGSVTEQQPDAVDEPVAAEEAVPNGADIVQPPAEIPSVTVRLGPMVRDGSEPQRTAKPLALRVDSFTVADMFLERFLDQVSDLAGVPITLDPAAFELSGVSPHAAVTVNASDVTLGQLLTSVLSKHRLELVEVGGKLRLALAKGDERSTKMHDVADLLESGATDARSIATLIEQFVLPTTWQAAGGRGKIEIDGGKLRVEQAKSVHHAIVVFCERLRLARGLRQRTDYPADRLSIDSPYREVETLLKERTTFTFLPWTRLAKVVHHWEQQSGVRILIDWSSLADEGLTPSSPIACSAVDRPWGEALDEILEPIGLAWWAIDRKTIQITTQDALSGIERTELHLLPTPLPEPFSGSEALVALLKNELRERAGDDVARVQIVQNQSGHVRLLVRGNALLHQYLTRRFKSTEQ
jgi:hypothetical protein